MNSPHRILILYIDSNQEETRFWQKQLGELGYDLLIAHTCVEAMRLLSENQFDLIVLNQQMPSYTCADMLDKLKEKEIHTPLIIVAKESDPEVVHQAYAFGVLHYIVQGPERHHISQLPAAIKQTIDQQYLIRELDEERVKTQRLNRNLMLLNRVSQVLTSTFDLTEVCNQLVMTIAQIIEAEGSTVWLLDKKTEEYLTCSAAYTAGALVQPEQLIISIDQGIAGWVATHGESLFVADVSHDSRFSPVTDNTLNFTTQSLITVPLQSHNKILGVIQVVNLEIDNATEDQVLTETLARSAAIAIENAYLFDELKNQNQELERQNADLDAYSGTVAHDLKNPVTHFLSYADDLRERFQDMSVPEIENHLDVILLQSRRMNLIIEELLLLARVRMTDKIPLDEIDMHEIVTNVLSQLEYDIHEKKAIIQLPKHLPEALGYGPWVESIWYNYLTNGLKYGGDPPQLEIGGFVDENGMVHYWVQDRGIGLTEEEQQKLFLPFPKLKRTQQQSNGLGLVIVKRIVEKLGGAVSIESIVGQGSRFGFSLPYWEDEADEASYLLAEQRIEGDEPL